MKPAQSLSIRKEDVVVTTGIFNRNSANALKDAGIICPPGGVKTWNKSTYGLRVAYAIGEFKANLSFSGWFDSNRQYTRYDSGHYSFYTWGCRPNLGRQLRLTLSYTVPYGKVVRRDNELQTSGSVNSAILK